MLTSPQPSSLPFNRNFPLNSAVQQKRPTANRDSLIGSKTDKEPLWIPMLQSASKGKDLSEKHLILLGGTSDLQREFLEQLNSDSSLRLNSRSNDRRKQKQNTPISNRFALGYTYYDVLDADQEDVLARTNVHMLANPSSQLAILLQPLLTARTIKDTLITILLDWNDPFQWPRQLRQWIRLLRKTVLDLDLEAKTAMEENMNAWRERRVGPETPSAIQQGAVAQLGPGEWDEGLGIPVSVVCVQSEKIERLERDLGWGDDQFDFLQQWLRTVLLKHGGSLIYTAPFEPNNVKTLIQTSLNIQSLLKRETTKHNVIDRDKILIPPNWDSWGKIRILREGFDPEIISNAWSVEIQDPPEDDLNLSSPNTTYPTQNDSSTIHSTTQPSSSAVSIFEQSLPNPIEDNTVTSLSYQPKSETVITATPLQDFLQTQLPILDKFKAEDVAENERIAAEARKPITSVDSTDTNNTSFPFTSGSMSPMKASASSYLVDSIGPHRVNVNGIDLDAEEATRRLTERENERIALRRGASESVMPGSGAASPAKLTRGASSMATVTNASWSEGPLTPGGGGGDGKPNNEALRGFFANLISKGEQGRHRGSATASGTGSPRRESPAPTWRREE